MAKNTSTQLLSETEAAQRLKLSTRTLRNWRVTGQGPKFVKVGRLIRYKIVEIEEWIEMNTRKSTSDKGILHNLLK